MSTDPIARRSNCGLLILTMAGISLILLCGCAGHDHTVSAPGKSRSGSSAEELRVMTFNLRVRKRLDGPNIWDLRRDLVVERIRDFDPDLLGTQEGLDFMESYLKQQLKDYTFFGAGVGDGSPVGEMCGVFYRTARFELLDRGLFWLSTTPDQPGSHAWGSFIPRMVTWVKLRPRDGGAAFFWFNITKTSIGGTTPIVPTLAIAVITFILGSYLGKSEDSKVLEVFDF